MSEIDVSECIHYYDGYCGMNNNRKIICEGKYCYFRVVQQLKEHCKFIDETNRILYQEKVDLIKENEELRLELEVYHKSTGANISKSLYEKLEKIKDIALNGVEDYMVDELAVILQIIEGI